MTDDSLWALWNLDAPGVLVRKSANEVFRGRRAGRDVYLRVTTLAHRSAAEVEAEIAWMRSLCADGERVAEALPSARGLYVEAVVRGGEDAVAVCTSAAEGRPAEKPDDFTPAIVTAWAALLADLHRHARTHEEPPHARRPDWNDDTVLAVALAADEAETAPAQARLRELVAWMRDLPRETNAFGLTHADLQLGNMTVARGPQLTAFDFDDSCHHFFVHDLAVAVTSMRKAAAEATLDLDLETRFLDAYARAGELDSRWLGHLDRFVHYRIALSACWASRSLTLGALDEGMQTWYRRSLPWWLRALAG